MEASMGVGKGRVRQDIRVASLGQPFSHYADAVRVGDLLFISGVTACDADGRVVGRGDVVAQARKVFENMQAVLRAGGMTFADVVRVTVYLTNVADREAINPVRREFFGEVRPASTLLEVAALVHPDMLVEIDAIAVEGCRSEG